MRARLTALAAAAVLLSACADQAPAVPAGPQAVSGSMVGGHVHHIALDGSQLLLGTHDGLWVQPVGTEPRRVSEPPFDVMGLARSGDRLLASGHPGPDMDAPADLGLIASDDGGTTWQSVSLSGEVDFHRLTAADDVVMGVAAADGALLRSEDGGLTWAVISGIAPVDVAVDPRSPDAVLVTTQDGLAASDDAGRTWSLLTGTPQLWLLAWAPGAVYGVDADGTIHASADAGRTWEVRGTLPAPPAALAADDDQVVAYVEGSVLESTDEGRTFTARVTELPG